MKSDWHSVPNLGSKEERFVPRLGKPGTLQRAPPRYLAFSEAFRTVNDFCWREMIQALKKLKKVRVQSTDEEWKRCDGDGLVDSLIRSFESQEHFGAIEVQVWWNNQGKYLQMPSHKDGITSLLHLGLTLGGHRTLRMGVFQTCGADGTSGPALPGNNTDKEETAKEKDDKEEDVWNEEKWVWHVAWSKAGVLKEINMHPGFAYISSPYCFEHGVMFTGGTRDQPLITLQCRLAFDAITGRKINQVRDSAMWDVVSTLVKVLRAAIDTGSLRMPSLFEVKEAEKRVPILWGVHPN